MAPHFPETLQQFARPGDIVCVSQRRKRALWLAGDQSYSGGSSISFSEHRANDIQVNNVYRRQMVANRHKKSVVAP